MAQNKRTKWLVYPGFQFTLLFVNLLLFLAFLAYVFYQIQSSFLYMAAIGAKADLAQDHPYYQYLGFQKDMIFRELLIGGGIFVLISFIFTIYISHKLVGPMFRLKTFLENYCDKKSGKTKLTFRKNDFFQEIPDLVNKAIGINSDNQKNDGNFDEKRKIL